MKKRYCVAALVLMVVAMAAACSSGNKMPKHRKNKHCDCPTFSYNFTTINSYGEYNAVER